MPVFEKYCYRKMKRDFPSFQIQHCGCMNRYTTTPYRFRSLIPQVEPLGKYILTEIEEHTYRKKKM
eukprot:snap_masked-scaffold_3-processed-gene-13.22-mRNA-1 protein AED:1.00 eAED:1.00 QI:0/-1/0/0/-1/1/1/0/65